MSRLAGLDRRAGRRACVGAECAQCCALGLPQNEPYSPPLWRQFLNFFRAGLFVRELPENEEIVYWIEDWWNLLWTRSFANRKTQAITNRTNYFARGPLDIHGYTRISRIFTRSLLQTFIRSPPSPTDFFNGEHSLHSTLCVEKLSASLSLSSVPFIRFWFYFFYMNNMKSQKLKVFWICKRLFLVLQKIFKAICYVYLCESKIVFYNVVPRVAFEIAIG